MNDHIDNLHMGEHDDPASLPPVVLGSIRVDDDPADETPKPLPLPYRRRPIPYGFEPSSREMMLGWCLWLLGSWIILGMGIDGTPLRWMIFASALGMMIVWPAYRLSQSGFTEMPAGPDPSNAIGADAQSPPTPAPSRRTRTSLLTPGLIFRDWFALNGVFQAVIWPHLLTGQWSREQACWVSGSVATWSLLVAAIVAWGCQSAGGIRRSAAMLVILLFIFGEPVALAFANELAQRLHRAELDWPMSVSPIEAIYALTARSIDFAPGAWVAPVGCVLLVSVLAWGGLLARTRRR